MSGHLRAWLRTREELEVYGEFEKCSDRNENSTTGFSSTRALERPGIQLFVISGLGNGFQRAIRDLDIPIWSTITHLVAKQHLNISGG